MVDVGLGGEIFSESFSMSVSTTHGIHISDYFFVGAELGYSYWHPYYRIIVVSMTFQPLFSFIPKILCNFAAKMKMPSKKTDNS